MFELTQEPIESMDQIGPLRDAQAGALATFTGWVRNHNDGKKVLHLEYEVYPALAYNEASVILQEAREQFDIHHFYAIHRYGTLQIGEAAVFVGVSASHRKAAFAACQYVIDQIKIRLPIWKKEYYADGTTEWCQPCPNCAAQAVSKDA